MASLASAKPRALAQSAINLCRQPGTCIAPDQVAPRAQMRPLTAESHMVESQPSGRRLGRSGPTASSEMGGFRRFGEAPEVELSDGTFEPGLLRPGRLPALIHPSAC
jgi:hypothetical protein